jgi:hypothetical protein
VNKLALEFGNETGGWFFSLHSNTIIQYSFIDEIERVEAYLADADTMSRRHESINPTSSTVIDN